MTNVLFVAANIEKNYSNRLFYMKIVGEAREINNKASAWNIFLREIDSEMTSLLSSESFDCEHFTLPSSSNVSAINQLFALSFKKSCVQHWGKRFCCLGGARVKLNFPAEISQMKTQHWFSCVMFMSTSCACHLDWNVLCLDLLQFRVSISLWQLPIKLNW